jgi:hypothetical protein
MKSRWIGLPLGLLLAGLLASGCIISSGDGDPCEGITCDGHGTCLEVGGEAECSCDAGYENDGPLHCVPAGNEIDLDWAFGPGVRDCADAYVDTVRVQLFDGADSLLDDELDCSAGGVIITDVADGSYDLELTGLGAGGEVWYSATEIVDVQGSDAVLGTVVLEPLADGHISFDWAFGASELDCAGAGVGRVDVAVYDMQGNLEYAPDQIPYCDEAPIQITNFTLQSWDLVLEAICESDLSVGYSFEATLEVSHPDDNDFGLLVLEGPGCP